AGVAVGDRDEPHTMTERGVLRRGASGALIAVIRMSAEGDDVQLTVRARRLRALRRRLGGDSIRLDRGRAQRVQGDRDADYGGAESLHAASLSHRPHAPSWLR